MQYSQQEIEEYTNILKKYSEPKLKSECKHLLEDCKPGFLVCILCGSIIQKIEHSPSFDDYQRCYFKKNSVYDRKYHFENKINSLIKTFDLDFDSKTLIKLYKILAEINNKEILKKLNSEFNRKRLIGVNFLIKKILENINPNLAEKIEINISPNTLELYHKYWDKIKPHLSF